MAAGSRTMRVNFTKPGRRAGGGTTTRGGGGGPQRTFAGPHAAAGPWWRSQRAVREARQLLPRGAGVAILTPGSERRVGSAPSRRWPPGVSQHSTPAAPGGSESSRIRRVSPVPGPRGARWSSRPSAPDGLDERSAEGRVSRKSAGGRAIAVQFRRQASRRAAGELALPFTGGRLHQRIKPVRQHYTPTEPGGWRDLRR